ncbi:hypothetical protein ABW21_db0209833 [Orbilia brochopaga]|nr:hypothetical protein ABW21_db0209833 [Drechslerella brochopaga]
MAVFPTSLEHSSASASATAGQSPAVPVQAPVTISLDQPEPVVKSVTLDDDGTQEAARGAPRRPPLRRDSMRRREALQKGKEGSRRRQRWENDNFLNNPSYAPPTAADFTPHPLHPTRIVRYEFATLWDPSNPAKYGYAAAHRDAKNTANDSRVPKNLKDRLKRSKGAIDLLRSLEEEVRRYAASLWGCVDEHTESVSAAEDDDVAQLAISTVEEELKDSEDEEIVFIPRMRTVTAPVSDEGKAKGKKGKAQEMELHIPVLSPPMEKSVFESPPDDQHASFGRWLVHSIALYYGLRSWSVTRGNPAMRVAFVGAHPGQKKKIMAGALVKRPEALPRPLWMLL